MNYKYLILVAFLLLVGVSKAQNRFPFIPPNQYQLTEKQLESIQINITPDVLLFTANGKILDPSSLSLMANPEYNPVFFANENGKVKSVVFVKKSNAPITVEKVDATNVSSGEAAFDFIATDVNGTSYKLSELRGKVIVLNFWFTKCGPCRVEIPHLNEIVEQYQDENVVFLAITFNKKELVTQFNEQFPFKFNLIPNANDIIQMYGINSYPTSMIIDKNGNVAVKDMGYRINIKEFLTTKINELL